MVSLRSFHRWHAIAMSVVVLMASISGLVHTWMAHNQAAPPPPRPTDPVDLTQVRIAPSALPGPATAVNLRTIGTTPWWQVLPEGGSAPRWFNAVTGAEDVEADARYAQGIAEGYLHQPVRKTAFLTSFDQEYLPIFRLLPVYRFDADDALHTRVYVSTLTGSVARHTDDPRQREATIFVVFHKWGFIKDRQVRDIALMTAMAGLVVLAGSGLWLAVATRRRPRSESP
jgi:hypothetical protein